MLSGTLIIKIHQTDKIIKDRLFKLQNDEGVTIHSNILLELIIKTD